MPAPSATWTSTAAATRAAAAHQINVTFSGLGTEVLSGLKVDTGSTTITSGTVELANVNALANSTLTNNAAGNGLIFANSGTYNVGSLSGSGNIALNYGGSGALTLSLGATAQAASIPAS